MEKTNQTNPEVDADFEAIKAKLPFDPDDKGADKKTVDDESKETPKEKKEDIDEKQQGEDKDDEGNKPKLSRPERYIPIKQYTDEKRSFQETIAEQEKKIAELSKIANLAEGSKKLEEAVKKYAEKHGVEEEIAREEVQKVKDILDLTSDREEKPQKKENISTISEDDRKILEEAQEIKAEKLFLQEFDDVAMPQIKDLFPNASPSKMAEAKEELQKLACTNQYLDKSLDYIVFKEKETFSKIFAPDRVGPEGGRSSSSKNRQTLSASDFEGGRTNFSELNKLSVEERDKIVKDFSPKTWDKYMHFLSINEDIEVS